MGTDLFETLKNRGYVYQATHEDAIKLAINGKPIVFYLGIDPTAESLHIGHFFALMLFRYLQDAGHKGILVIGGATALVGDPSGKNELRRILSKEEVTRNLEEVKALTERFIDVDGDNPAIILNNADWINHYSYVDFMREVGIHFNVNKMLAAETYANRLSEGGLTFLEMGYMLMQAYDFVHLNREYHCILQIGGSDQWGNIVAGINLGRKLSSFTASNVLENDMLLGLTCPLLMTRDGKKMGKTEKGTLWVAREKTTIFDFYQYFYNVDDQDVKMLLNLFTKISTEDIEELYNRDVIAAKRLMAYEITKLVHGTEEADKVVNAVHSLFGNGSDYTDVPTYEIDQSILEHGINIVELLTLTQFLPTKAEARRLIQQGGIAIDDKKISDIDYYVHLGKSGRRYIMLKKGKKTFLKVCY